MIFMQIMTTMFEFIQNLLLRRKYTDRQQACVCLTEHETRLNMKSGRCRIVHKQFYWDEWFRKVCDSVCTHLQSLVSTWTSEQHRLMHVLILLYCRNYTGLLFRMLALRHVYHIRVALHKYTKFQRKFLTTPACPKSKVLKNLYLCLTLPCRLNFIVSINVFSAEPGTVSQLLTTRML